MATRLADRLDAVRRRHFIGRAKELELFESALLADELPFQIIDIFGPGGVGKTSLLNEFSAVAARHGIRSVYIDARNVEPAPLPFLNSLRSAAGINQQTHPLEYFGTQPDRFVICIDTYETFEALEEWLIEEFLPQLPENVVTAFAGRNPPPAIWRIDPGWQSVVHILPLRNFHVDESLDYLTRRNVPTEQHQTVLNFTYGHPLALSLVADVFAQRSDVHFQPEAEPDIVRVLLEQFMQKVPGPAHRAALEACALSRVMTEGLLAEMLTMPDPHELFNWLRSLSFIESGQEGLFPHDLAREALAADLRWRNPDWYIQLHHRARNYYAGRLSRSSSHEQQRLLFDYVFLHRDNPVMRAIFNWQGVGNALADSGREEDWRGLQEMVEAHEGADSARLAAYWFKRQPENTLVLRTPQGTPIGFMLMIALHETTDEDETIDPAVRATRQYLQTHAPLRSGEGATLFRYWMAKETYQSVSPIQSLIFVNVGRHYLITPALAYTFFPCADPDFWKPGFAYIDLHRLPEADYTIGGHRYGVYGHDWRVVPPMQWLAILAEREVAGSSVTTSSQTPSARQIIVLSEDTFSDAVVSALRSYTRPDMLSDNPLLRSRMLAERTSNDAGIDDDITALVGLIRETTESLQSSPRDTKLYRAIYRTYLNPASTQERAAELLDLPFSTYRRHLKSGIERLTELLWNQEIAASKKPSG